MKIPITRPVFGPEERAAVVKPLESGWVVQGPFVAEFEQKFSAFSGAAHSVATSSCTTAMHIAAVALGLEPGDEVIVPAFTWVSTPNVVEYAGAAPVFCDIDLATFNIDVRQMASLITKKTVGLFPVHLFGLCADMDPILDLARKHGLRVQRVVQGQALRQLRRHRLLQLSSAQGHHHRRGRNDYDREGGAGDAVAIVTRPRRLAIRPRASSCR
jgi:dTDP-4-amino-4,6-dideoxygalactose transaminase